MLVIMAHESSECLSTCLRAVTPHANVMHCVFAAMPSADADRLAKINFTKSYTNSSSSPCVATETLSLLQMGIDEMKQKDILRHHPTALVSPESRVLRILQGLIDFLLFASFSVSDDSRNWCQDPVIARN